jgi:hypothetical protein
VEVGRKVVHEIFPSFGGVFNDDLRYLGKKIVDPRISVPSA